MYLMPEDAQYDRNM